MSSCYFNSFDNIYLFYLQYIFCHTLIDITRINFITLVATYLYIINLDVHILVRLTLAVLAIIVVADVNNRTCKVMSEMQPIHALTLTVPAINVVANVMTRSPQVTHLGIYSLKLAVVLVVYILILAIVLLAIHILMCAVSAMNLVADEIYENYGFRDAWLNICGRKRLI